QERKAVRQRVENLGNVRRFERGLAVIHRPPLPRAHHHRLRRGDPAHRRLARGRVPRARPFLRVPAGADRSAPASPGIRTILCPAGTPAIPPLPAPTMAPSPILTLSAIPTLPASTAKSSTTELPEMPHWDTMMQCRPIDTLWPICTRLSILVPSPITVSRKP